MRSVILRLHLIVALGGSAFIVMLVDGQHNGFRTGVESASAFEDLPRKTPRDTSNAGEDRKFGAQCFARLGCWRIRSL
jgi:hypothetical protein